MGQSASSFYFLFVKFNKIGSDISLPPNTAIYNKLYVVNLGRKTL